MSAPKDPRKRAEWIKKIRAAKRGKKQTPEHIANRSAALKGHKPWSIGLTKAIDPRLAAMSATKKGKKLVMHYERYPKKSAAKKGKKHPERGPAISAANKGKKHPKASASLKKYFAEHPGAHAGENSPRWKGGPSKRKCSLIGCVRGGFEYQRWRNDVFTRDKFACQECGRTRCYLEAHHIDPFINIFRKHNIATYEMAKNCPELWGINNGITLCENCHDKKKKETAKRIKEALIFEEEDFHKEFDESTA